MSKQRVLTAAHLAEPDRVPTDFHANPWVLKRLHRDLGTSTHRALLERLRSDVVDLRGVVDPKYCGTVPQSRELGDGVRENFWGWRQKVMQTATGPEDCFVEFVLADAALIEIGVDILDPLQAAADGMEPQALKDAYGNRVCLHGGICTQYLLPRGRPKEVRDEVRRRLEILGAGGGYILAPCHVLQTDVPTENILAMSDTGFESGRYS